MGHLFVARWHAGATNARLSLSHGPACCRSEAEAMRRTVQSFKREGFLHDQSVTESAQNYQMHFLSEVSTLWRALPWEGRVMDAVTRLLDSPNIEVHLDQVINLQVSRPPAYPLSRALTRCVKCCADVFETTSEWPRYCFPPRQRLCADDPIVVQTIFMCSTTRQYGAANSCDVTTFIRLWYL